MRIKIGGKWNFVRLLRMVVGINGVIQGLLIKEYIFSIGGFLLVYMALAEVTTGGGSKNEVEWEEVKLHSKRRRHEKVDSYQ